MTLKPTSDAVAVTQGHAGDAIDFALGHCGPDEAFAFLDDWRADRANEWPGYVKWLSAQYRHRTAAQPEREAVFGETDAERVARAMDPPLWADDEDTAHMAASPLQVCYARKRSLDRARLFLTEYAALTTPAPARSILLEMAEASDEHKKWERRWRALGQMYAREKPCFVDSDGDWCLRDFLDYAGAICGFGGDILGSATPAPAASRADQAFFNDICDNMAEVLKPLPGEE